ncbi:MAG: ECF transporter S component [Lachnospiraceae bacterium]|nr:ECF transporter S component [Lachnospiraceae bacterium]
MNTSTNVTYEKNVKLSTRQLCLTAILIAFTFVVTRFLQIPIPLGYFNIGNSVILISCLFVSSPYGILVGSIGSALADLTSYPEYALPTLIIKAIMPVIFYAIIKIHKDSAKMCILAFAVATLIPLFGYTLVGGILSGSITAGFIQFPGLLLEYVANIIIFCSVLNPCLKYRKIVNF